MSGRKSVGGWEDIFGNGVENRGIVLKYRYVEDFLRITKTQMFELGIETSVFRAEVGNSETCRDLKESQVNLVIGRSRGQLHLHQ